MGSDQGAAPIRARIRDAGLADRIHLAGDLHHDAFLTLLTRSTIYVRTPSKDGVASSVLEALALKVPVVASENGTRPAGVVTFRPDDPADLAMKIAEVLSDYDEVRRNLVPPVIRDTVAEEAALLAAAGLPSRPATA
jgi:glycosyltransferase involved in cell wall biosynthesis